MAEVLTRTTLTKEQIIGVVACAQEGMTRAEAAEKLNIPVGTMGYIVRQFKAKGITCNFKRAKGQAWEEAFEILVAAQQNSDG